jgi:nucleotide-binding universal stress UspA family protein
MHYKHIMLPIDGSPLSRKAEKECFAFAKSTGAKVTAIHVVPRFYLHLIAGTTPKSVHAKIEKEHEEEARKLAQKLISSVTARAKEKSVNCDGIVVVGDYPYEEIIKSADNRKCDLIMMASHGRRGRSSLLLGSETAKVLLHSKVPVLVVR